MKLIEGIPCATKISVFVFLKSHIYISVFLVSLHVYMSTHMQWRTEGRGFGCSNPSPRNSEDIGGVLNHISKKNRRLDFHL